MKGKLVAAAASNGGNNQTDLLVCFPSRAHLALMPKPICSPSRPAELPKRHHQHHHHQHHSRHQHGATATTKPAPMKRNAGSGSSRRKSSSPLFKAKSRDHRDVEEELDEPTSPRITCAGQIRVRPTSKARSSNASSSRPSTEGKNWMSVMEEIERMRKDGKKKPCGGGWLEAIGIKKDALQMFSSFHGLRFNMGCFGSFPGSIDCTSDDDEEEEDEGISAAREEEDQEASGSNSNDVFSKWFMLIEENHDIDFKEEIKHDDDDEHDEEEYDDNENEEEKENMKNSSVVPPPNALLLMRCRSAPAKGLINRAEQLETEETRNANKALRDQEDHQKEKEEKEKLVVMRCAPDFFKVSMDIAKETWVVGGELDLLARSRSCRR